MILVNLGAVAIAVLFSILPALRAALLHPVRALRSSDPCIPSPPAPSRTEG